MKKIILIIIVILLFVGSILIFWAALSPKTFFKTFAMYPAVEKTATQIGLISTQGVNISATTTSEPISGQVGQIIINNNAWSVEIANNDQARTNGLSNRRTLYPKHGMLFAFDKMDSQVFWMKDMLIPIDMIFFDSNWKIVEIDNNLQPNSFPKTFGGDVKSQYVLEVTAQEADSYKLKVGDQAIFLNK